METELIKVHNSFVESIYNTNLMARKLLYGLLCMNNTVQGLKITAKKKEICQLMGVNEDNPREVKAALKNLMGKIIEIEDYENKKWDAFVFVTDAGIDNGDAQTIYVEIHKKSEKYLRELKEKFTVLKIANMRPLRSKYALRMYELCQENKFKGNFEISVEDLRKILICDNTMMYGMFKKRVLEIARKQLRKNCDICFDYVEIKKTGTKGIEKIKFNIYENKKFQIENGMEDSIPGLEPSEEEKAVQSRKLEIEKQLRERGWQGNFQDLLQEACPTTPDKFEAVEHFVLHVLGNEPDYINKKMNPGLLRVRIRENAERVWEIRRYDEVLEKNKWERYLMAFREYPGREKMHANAAAAAKESKTEIAPLEEIMGNSLKLKKMYDVMNSKYAGFQEDFEKILKPYMKD